MARILLGVSGGIAAYKALRAGAARDPGRTRRSRADDPGREALRGLGLVRGHRRSAGPRRRVRARPPPGRLPRRSAARPRPDRPPRAGRQRRRVLDRPRVGEHDRQARGRDRRLDADHLVPRLPGPARRCSGDERPHVRGPRHPGEPGDAARAWRARDRARGGRARLARRDGRRQAAVARSAAGRGRGAPARRAGILGRAAGAGHRRRNPRADRLGPLHRQPLERANGAGAGRRGQAAWGGGDPGRGERLAFASRQACGGSTSRPRASWRPPCGRSSPPATCC